MFESVTKKRKNPIINFFGWFLLSLVCVVFVFIGFSPGSGFLESGGAAAEVNGEAISLREYKELLDRLEDSRRQGENGRQRGQLERNAINLLINQSLITQGADELNVFVGHQEIVQALFEIKAFRENGTFSRLLYKRILNRIGLTESEFEGKIRNELVVEKMKNLIHFAIKDTDYIDEFETKMNSAQIDLSYVALNQEKFKSKEEYEGVLEELRVLVKGGKFKGLEGFLADKKLKWSDTGYFSITEEQIPGLGADGDFLDQAMEISPDKKYANDLIYRGDKIYLLKLKGAKLDQKAGAEKGKMDFFKQLMKQQNVNLMLEQWTHSLRASAKIKINPRLIR